MEKLSNEAILNYLKDSAQTFSFVLNEQFLVIHSNKAFNAVFDKNGLVENAILKHTLSIDLLKDLLSKEKEQNLELPIYSPVKKKNVVLELEIRYLNEASGKYYHLLGSNIIKLKNHQLEIEKYKLIAKKTTSGVIITDAFGYATWVNKGFTKMTGFSPRDILGKKPGEVLQGEKTDKVAVRKMREAIEKSEPFEVEILNYHKNGKEIWISITCDPIKNEFGELEGFIAIQPEVTQRKLKEQKLLKENHDRFKAVFESALNAIIIANDQMQCIDANPAACDMLGYSKKEFIGKSITEFTEYKKSKKLWVDFIEHGIQRGEIELIDKKDKKKKAKYYAVSNILEDTHLSVLLDITEQEKMQKVLENKNAELNKINQEKNKLFSIISHDLKSPLSRLAGLLDLLRDGDMSKKEFDRFVHELSEDVNDTSNLLNNLLIWSSNMLEGIKLRPVSCDIKKMVTHQFGLQKRNAKRKKIILQNEVLDGTIANADKNMIDIVIRNLLSNAIKFCRENSEIIITANVSKKKVTVCVADTGVGIPKSNLKKIFSENLSTKGTKKEIGNGIGLSLCKEFIERNKGKIWVESELGVGSKFYFSLQAK